MFQLLQRISWWISLCLGFVISLLFQGWFFGPEEIIMGFVFSFLIKHFIFSQAFIKKWILTLWNEAAIKDNLIQQKDIDTPLQNDNSEDWESFTEQAAFTQTTNTPLENTDTEIKKEKRKPNIVQKFFSENILAKIWGIIVFLGVLFFLSAIIAAVWPVAKIVIGFILGFSIFWAGVLLDKKWWNNEGRIVIGIAILINYLVILSGRYILGDDSNSHATLLSVSTTLIFLVFNTAFAVTAALLYNSRTLLIFSFIFAYINPLIAGWSADEPYTLLWYTLIVTLGAMYMSYKRKDNILFPLSFILAAFLCLIAPWDDSWGWITKLLSVNILWAISLYVSTIFKTSYKYIYELLIWGTFFLIGIMWLLGIESLSVLELSILWVSSLILMGFCYIFMNRAMYTYSIGTLGGVLTLSPALILSGVQDTHLFASLSIIITFIVMNLWILLMRNKELLSWKNTWNITIWLLSWAAFITTMVYVFWNEYFPWMMQGFAFMGIAQIYVALAFFMVQKIGFKKMQDSPENKNIFYAVSAIGISLFTLAIAFVFAEHKEIISIVWLLEASVLLYINSKVDSYKIAIAGLVLMIIGVLRIIPFLDTQLSESYGMIVGILILVISLLYNCFLIYSSHKESFIRSELRYIHNFFHIIWIGTLSFLFFIIIESRLSAWESFWYFASCNTLLLIYYAHIRATPLRIFSSGIYILFLLIHISLFAEKITSSEGINTMSFIISTCVTITFILPYIYEKVSLKKLQITYLVPAFLLYLFCISTLYIYYFFPNTFSVTIYWGSLAFIVLMYGIERNIQAVRTIGLYLIILTTIKIFFHDIWVGISNEAIQFLALMIVGVLMIILSTMYTKKYGNTMNSEFRISNLFPKKEKDNTEEISQEKVPSSSVQNDIESIDVRGISGVRMRISGDKVIQVRAENLIKIAKLICKSYGKNNFEAGELKKAYEMISSDYKSSLSPSQYKKIQDVVQLFVEKWGSIEFVTK